MSKTPLLIKKLVNPSDVELESYLRQGWKVLSEWFLKDNHKVTLVK